MQVTRKNILLKVDAKILFDGKGRVDEQFLRNFAKQIVQIWQSGDRVILIVPRAMALGFAELGWDMSNSLDFYKTTILQRAAAVGQPLLLAELRKVFQKELIKTEKSESCLHIGHFPFTHNQLKASNEHAETKKFLLACLEEDSFILPVVNINDRVSEDNPKKSGKQGDNDLLTKELAMVLKVSYVVFLTSVDGIYNTNKKINVERSNGIIHCLSGKDQISLVMRDLQQQLLADTGKDISPAGMLSRVGCASDLCFNGIPSCIVNGREKDVLLRLCKGEKIGTRFDPQSPSKSSKKTT